MPILQRNSHFTATTSDGPATTDAALAALAAEAGLIDPVQEPSGSLSFLIPTDEGVAVDEDAGNESCNGGEETSTASLVSQLSGEGGIQVDSEGNFIIPQVDGPGDMLVSEEYEDADKEEQEPAQEEEEENAAAVEENAENAEDQPEPVAEERTSTPPPPPAEEVALPEAKVLEVPEAKEELKSEPEVEEQKLEEPKDAVPEEAAVEEQEEAEKEEKMVEDDVATEEAKVEEPAQPVSDTPEKAEAKVEEAQKVETPEEKTEEPAKEAADEALAPEKDSPEEESKEEEKPMEEEGEDDATVEKTSSTDAELTLVDVKKDVEGMEMDEAEPAAASAVEENGLKELALKVETPAEPMDTGDGVDKDSGAKDDAPVEEQHKDEEEDEEGDETPPSVTNGYVPVIKKEVPVPVATPSAQKMEHEASIVKVKEELEKKAVSDDDANALSTLASAALGSVEQQQKQQVAKVKSEQVGCLFIYSLFNE